MTEMTPQIGDWYRNRENGARFEIVAIDDRTNSIEIQYFEGEVEELDEDIWEALNLEPIAAPEDWSGPFDDVEPEDLDSVENAGNGVRGNPLDRLD